MHFASSLHHAALATALLLLPGRAAAQATAPEPGSEDRSVTPPKLLRFVPASPPGDAPPPEDVRVVLELVVDETGQVAEATVAESGGPAFDARAVEAARGFSFEPARQGGAAVRVKIRYAYVFEAAAPAPEPAPVPEPAPAPEPPRAPAPPPAPAPKPDAPLAEFEATATVEAPPREVTKRTVDPETIRRVPGTRGDVLRSIEVMPGVARTGADFGDPVLRGSSSSESRTLLNGTPVPFLYHFGGLTSFLSPKLVSRVELYPGNFSVRYGRVSGGVVEVRARDPESPRLRAAVDLNFVDSAAFVEVPLGEDTGVAAAVRRSNIDFFFENFVPEDAYSVVAAPIYYDYQLFLSHRFSPSTRLRVLGYGGQDSIELFFRDPPDEDPGFTGTVDARFAFHRLGVELETQPSQEFSTSLSATVGHIDITQHIGPLRQIARGPELFARAESTLELHPTLRATLGADLVSSFLMGSYRGPYPGTFEGESREADPFATRRLVSDEAEIDIVQPGFYAELGYRPVPELLITPGARGDYLGNVGHWSVDPRLAVRYELSRATTVKGGVGWFTQAPEFWQALDSVGNPDLDPYRALQTSAGVEQAFGERVKVGLEGFYKRIEDYVVATENREAPHYLNTGEGRIYGGELSAEARTRGDGLFYLAYTLSRSERKNGPDADWRLFDLDQTHVLSLVASQGLGKGWEVGARFRLVSGNPSTPITGSVYDARTGVYLPTYGATNSARNPAFHQLDLRVEKAWRAGPLTVAAYLDLQNAYNAQNQEGYRYSYDYSEREAVTGLPILPNLGVRGEL